MPVLHEQALGFGDRKGPGKCSNLLISHHGCFQSLITAGPGEEEANAPALCRCQSQKSREEGSRGEKGARISHSEPTGSIYKVECASQAACALNIYIYTHTLCSPVFIISRCSTSKMSSTEAHRKKKTTAFYSWPIAALQLHWPCTTYQIP